MLLRAQIDLVYMSAWKLSKVNCLFVKKLLPNIWKQRDSHFQGIFLDQISFFKIIMVLMFLRIFRFYFVSSADLLDILSNGNEPEKVMKHLTKLFDSMAKLKSDKTKEKVALGMQAKDGENVEFPTPCDLSGAVEIWLNRLLDMQCNTILHWLTEAVQAYEEKPREQWVLEFPGQIALTGSQIWWTTEVNIAFGKLEEGFENALKDYLKKQIAQLNNLITLLLGDLTSGDRQKIMTICTIDVHARDVVMKMIAAKIENSGEFLWQCQLRHRWDEEKKDCFANICDAQFKYAHEYLGNQPRLVVTPLTDRY